MLFGLDNNKAFFFVICFGKLIAAVRLFVYDFSFYIKQNAYTMYAMKYKHLYHVRVENNKNKSFFRFVIIFHKNFCKNP